MRSFIFFSALPLLASAWSEHSLLTRATGNTTSCATSDKACGAFCIPSNYTCCPDLEGGCASTSLCQKGDNGQYGCCPLGDTCSGNGGAEFLNETSSSASATSTSTATASVATKSTSPTNGAQHIFLSQGLTVAVIGAGIAALL